MFQRTFMGGFKPIRLEESPIQPETTEERQRRHDASIEVYRSLVDPSSPPRKPFLLEHHFLAAEEADVNGFVQALESNGYQIDLFAYDPDTPERAWRIVALKVDLLEERRILALSDDLEALSRQHDVNYDGWLTRVE